MWDKTPHFEVEHISLAEWADVVLVAPATYNIVGKVANGIADDMLSTVISATTKPVFFALAMNVNMYNNPILKENINKLKKYGYRFIDSDEGFLACNVNAKGRLKDEKEIVKIIEDHFQEENINKLKKYGYRFIDSDEGFLACNVNAKGRLKDEKEIVKIIEDHFQEEELDRYLTGKTVLITAGRTEEAIDPVRYISNRSSGQMGYSLAIAARKLGAEVILVSGPTELSQPEGDRWVTLLQ